MEIHDNATYLLNAITIVSVVLALTPVIIARIKSRRDQFLVQLEDSRSREYIRVFLSETPSATDRYHDAVSSIVDKFDELYGKKWSARLFDRIFLFSLFSIFSLLVFYWMYWGVETIGEIKFLPELPAIKRFAVVLFACAAAYGIFAWKKRRLSSKLWHEAAGILKGVFNTKEREIIVFREVFEYMLIAVIVAGIASGISGAIVGVFIVIIVSVLIAVDSKRSFVGASAIILAVLLTYMISIAGELTVAGVQNFYKMFAGGMEKQSENMQVAVLLVFVGALPIANAVTSYLVWSSAVEFIEKFHRYAHFSRSPAWIAGAIFMDLLIAIACLAGLCVLMALFLEALNQFFLWRGFPVIDWRGQVALAVEYPFTKGVLVTGMLVTTLIPTMLHIAWGLEHAFTAPTPDTRAAAALIKDDMSAGDKQHVADVMVARDWYLFPCFAFAAVLVLALAALIGLGAAPLGLTLADIAYCSASLIDGQCPWTDGVTK